ncbi:MAG: hypothetical protein AB1Z23_12480 [Eubacteriales bacterium]
MNIGILVYSLTGNTLQVAEKVKEKLEEIGQNVEIARITLSQKSPNSPAPVKLDNVPDLLAYDKLIIGSPINGFSLSAPMREYLQNHADLKGKTINCYVTQHFRQAALGGNRGIRQMTDLCEEKGARVQTTAIVHWSAQDRESQIKEAVKRLTRI